MKYYFLILLVSKFCLSYGQNKVNFSGGFESNAQWYLNDKQLNVEHPEFPLRSNSYLLLNSNFKNFYTGVQLESYNEKALLNFNPKYEKTNVATYFVQYKTSKIDLTAGYFYEQFGSGLLLRTWEDRQLGLNNALRGGRIIFKPTDYCTLKTIYGQQRSGFNVSNGKIYGADVEIQLSKILKFEKNDLFIGGTFVGRDEQIQTTPLGFLNLTTAFGARINYSGTAFYISSEFNFKSDDPVVEFGKVQYNFIKPGTALLLNVGYVKKGFGVDASFRRLENMSFFSDRLAKGNQFNDKILNFLPSLTKQHHTNLANIYVYQSQPNVSITDELISKSGEIGGQVDVFYTIKKNTIFGGKHGTKVAFNFSNWYGLKGIYIIETPRNYTTDFLGFNKKYFTDYNLEITKKWNSKWSSVLTYINQFYNKKLVEETFGEVNTNIVAAEGTYKFANAKSVRILGEHMWADSDKKNWASATIEVNLNANLSVFGTDLYNYGNEIQEARNHYYNFGGTYRKNASRLSISYGRQRGGLLCVGGVCRFVPESSGVSLSLNTSF